MYDIRLCYTLYGSLICVFIYTCLVTQSVCVYKSSKILSRYVHFHWLRVELDCWLKKLVSRSRDGFLYSYLAMDQYSSVFLGNWPCFVSSNSILIFQFQFELFQCSSFVVFSCASILFIIRSWYIGCERERKKGWYLSDFCRHNNMYYYYYLLSLLSIRCIIFFETNSSVMLIFCRRLKLCPIWFKL